MSSEQTETLNIMFGRSECDTIFNAFLVYKGPGWLATNVGLKKSIE